MPRTRTSVYIEEGLLREIESLAARVGKEDYEVFEEALRAYLGLGKASRTHVRSKKARGKYARVATSSEAFARRKQEEVKLEGDRE